MRTFLFPLFIAGVVLAFEGCSGDEFGPLELGDASPEPDAKVTPKLDASVPDVVVPVDTGPPQPDIDTFAWTTVGNGVALKDTQNPNGKNVLIAYAGYNIDLGPAKAWVSELYRTFFLNRGVRYVAAIQGPADPAYNGLEIANTKLGQKLIPLLDTTTKFGAIVAHSSGSFVAHEFMNQLIVTTDPDGKLFGKVVYFNLDGALGSGDYKGFSTTTATYVKNAFFVGAIDGTTKSPNYAAMQTAGQMFAAKGGFLSVDTSGSGCGVGVAACVHSTLVNTKPHASGPPSKADSNSDYSDFAGHPVNQKYLTTNASLF